MGGLFGKPKLPAVKDAPPLPTRTSAETQELAAEQRRRLSEEDEQTKSNFGGTSGVMGLSQKYLGGGR
jgi:hypothetical protein